MLRKCKERSIQENYFVSLVSPSLFSSISNIPVNTGRLKNVFKTSFVRYGCLKDVSETACAHWDYRAFPTYTFFI